MELPKEFIVRILNKEQWDNVISILCKYYREDLGLIHEHQNVVAKQTYSPEYATHECICSDNDGFMGFSELEWFEKQTKMPGDFAYGKIIYTYESFIELFKYKLFNIESVIDNLDKIESKLNNMKLTLILLCVILFSCTSKRVLTKQLHRSKADTCLTTYYYKYDKIK